MRDGESGKPIVTNVFSPFFPRAPDRPTWQALIRDVGATGGRPDEGEGPSRRTRIPAPAPGLRSGVRGDGTISANRQKNVAIAIDERSEQAADGGVLLGISINRSRRRPPETPTSTLLIH
jgi:hypothetical protein